MPLYLTSATYFTGSNLVIWSVCIGICVAICAYFVQKHSIGGFINRLLSEECSDAESAKSLEDLGFGRNFIVKLALFDNKPLRNTVILADSSNLKKVKRGIFASPTFANARFYIPVDKSEKAKALCNHSIKWYLLPILIIVSIFVAYIATLILPIVMSML
ncbi:MAG: hypothetical protein J6B34_05605 [Clostridia bacterium]|nr:hypothetical protein [Clostridia bacterium]